MLRRTFLAAAAGLAAAAAFDPVAAGWLLPASVATLVLCVRGLRPLRAATVGLVYGAGFMFVLQFWMRVVGWDAWLAIAATEAAFFAPFAAGTALLVRARGWPVTVALLWLAVEVWRGQWPFSGMPWGRLAFASADTPWAAALPYVGANGVSLLIALTGTTLAWLLVEGRHRPRAAVAAVATVAALTVAPVAAPFNVEPEATARVAVVQGNVPGDGSDILLDYRQVTRNHRDATVALAARVAAGDSARPDFVLWPENSTAVDPFRDFQTRTDIQTATDAVGVPILVGAIADAPEEGKLLNQGIVWNPGIGGGDRYTKRHPVPFGEYVPWRGNPFTDRFQRLDLVPRDMLGGTRLSPLRIAGLEVADAICFDVAYDDGLYAQVRGGAQLITVQTSNAMYIHTHQIEQQFEITRVRALETGRAVAVASPNGRSGVIDPDGEAVSVAPTREQVVLEETLPLATSLTPAMRLGEWVGRGAVPLALLALLWALLDYRRSRPGSPGNSRPVPGVRPTATPQLTTEVIA